MKRTSPKQKREIPTPSSVSKVGKKKHDLKLKESPDNKSKTERPSGRGAGKADEIKNLKAGEAPKRRRRTAKKSESSAISQRTVQSGKSSAASGTYRGRHPDDDTVPAKRKKTQLETLDKKAGSPPKKSAKKTSTGKKEKASITTVRGLKSRPRSRAQKKKATEPRSFKRHPAAQHGFPDKLEENEMLVMAVDPYVIYASWAIRKEDFPEKRGAAILRVCDVTGEKYGSPGGYALIAAPVRKRIGVEFLDARLSGKDVIVEIGTLDARGRFRPIVRSNRVSIPESQYAGESGAFFRTPGTDTPYGY
jgi:hypothetical protein